MNGWRQWIVFIMVAFYLPIAFGEDITGNWTTIDDKNSEKRAVVNLVMEHNTLTGTITQVYPRAGDSGYCTKCPGSFKDKRIVGLQIIWGLKDKGQGRWEDGHILDASTGKIYDLKLQINKNRLYIRGYIGLPLLGRTQVWIR